MRTVSCILIVIELINFIILSLSDTESDLDLSESDQSDNNEADDDEYQVVWTTGMGYCKILTSKILINIVPVPWIKPLPCQYYATNLPGSL